MIRDSFFKALLERMDAFATQPCGRRAGAAQQLRCLEKAEHATVKSTNVAFGRSNRPRHSHALEFTSAMMTLVHGRIGVVMSPHSGRPD